MRRIGAPKQKSSTWNTPNQQGIDPQFSPVRRNFALVFIAIFDLHINPGLQRKTRFANLTCSSAIFLTAQWDAFSPLPTKRVA
jgi:hypothetical protein